MSFLKLSAVCDKAVYSAKFLAPPATKFSKRYLHRSSDVVYMAAWKAAKVDFIKELDRVKEAGHHFYHSPKLVEQTIKVCVAMQEKGLIPFVHAAPASQKVIMETAEVAYPMQLSENPFKYLRVPREENKISYEQSKNLIPKTVIKSPKSTLLSMSYALTSAIAPLESAASWGFVNHFGNYTYFTIVEEFNKIVTDSGFEYGSKLYNLITSLGVSCIHKYNLLSVGDFYVIGIPKNADISKFAYDSLPYNVPSGRDIAEVAMHPERFIGSLKKSGALMATLMLYERTLSPESGIWVVRANNKNEVDTCCAGMSFTPMRDIEEFLTITSRTSTDFEKSEVEMREKADQELSKMLKVFKAALSDPESVVVEEDMLKQNCVAMYPEAIF